MSQRERWDPRKAKVSMEPSGFKKFVADPLKKILKEKSGLRVLKDVFESMGKPFTLQLETFQDIGKSLSKSFEGAIMEALQPLLQPILDGLNWLSSKIRDGLSWLVDNITSWWSDIWTPPTLEERREAYKELESTEWGSEMLDKMERWLGKELYGAVIPEEVSGPDAATVMKDVADALNNLNSHLQKSEWDVRGGDT